MGCIGRRSPGRSGGRGAPTPPGPCGRGRWKIGWPGTGRPGIGRPVIGRAAIGTPGCGGGGAGRGGGALYTGRGPVCGTIMRGAGGVGATGAAETGGATGRGATGVCGAAEAATVGDTGAAGGATTAGGAITGRGSVTTGGADGAAGAVGLSAIDGATTTGRAATGGAAGVATGDPEGAEVTPGLATGGTATGRAAVGGGATGRVGGAGAEAASLRWVIAFSTSPGREMFDKSILVLISSSPRAGRALLADDACASDEPRRCLRTFSASCSSRELECVFFSVTPTTVSTSRIALLLTSSSLARSLIRTLLIRPFLYPALCLSLHRSLTEFSFSTRMLSISCRVSSLFS